MESQTETTAVAGDVMTTAHAPAERLAAEELLYVIEAIASNPPVQVLLDGYPGVAVLLNRHRQIIACNRALLTLLGQSDQRTLIGRRVGEVLGCIHAVERSGGCGTSETCRTCGAVNAMLRCQESREAIRDTCRISAGDAGSPDALELQVVATPLDIDGQELLIFAAHDISAQKRREALERLFFHDTLNVAGGIQGLAELLVHGERFDPNTHPERLRLMAHHLVEQIRAQRDLAAAERGELTPTWSTIFVRELFEELRATYEAHPVSHGREIRFDAPHPPGLALQCDSVLLSRTLGNLVKNALEASDPGQRVTISCESTDEEWVRFSVHNQTAMPRNVQLQVFKRSFSTKDGKGRGLGTFSVKLLTSRYLGGRVEFTSTAQSGTTFAITVPRRRTLDWRPQARSEQRGPSSDALAGCWVLLAEDGHDNQRIIAHVLKAAGAEVAIEGDGRRAVDAAVAARDAGQPFDVILMDMQMPVMDGYEATSALRREGYDKPIIALTAHESATDRRRCLDAGCDDFATKPIDRAALIETVVRRFRPA